jgi:hypothetical protein
LLAFGEEEFLASLAMAGSEAFFNKLLAAREPETWWLLVWFPRLSGLDLQLVGLCDWHSSAGEYARVLSSSRVEIKCRKLGHKRLARLPSDTRK